MEKTSKYAGMSLYTNGKRNGITTTKTDVDVWAEVVADIPKRLELEVDTKESTVCHKCLSYCWGDCN